MPEYESTEKIKVTIQGVEVYVWLCVSDVDIALQVEHAHVVEDKDFDNCGCGVVGIDQEEGNVILYGGLDASLGINVDARGGNYYAKVDRDDEDE
jgi:hypothetical protein